MGKGYDETMAEEKNKPTLKDLQERIQKLESYASKKSYAWVKPWGFIISVVAALGSLFALVFLMLNFCQIRKQTAQQDIALATAKEQYVQDTTTRRKELDSTWASWHRQEQRDKISIQELQKQTNLQYRGAIVIDLEDFLHPGDSLNPTPEHLVIRYKFLKTDRIPVLMERLGWKVTDDKYIDIEAWRRELQLLSNTEDFGPAVSDKLFFSYVKPSPKLQAFYDTLSLECIGTVYYLHLKIFLNRKPIGIFDVTLFDKD
jgi:hypothetical protein